MWRDTWGCCWSPRSGQEADSGASSPQMGPGARRTGVSTLGKCRGEGNLETTRGQGTGRSLRARNRSRRNRVFGAGSGPQRSRKIKKNKYLLDLATRMIYQKGVIGFAGKCGSQGGGVGTDPHVLRSVWEARQVAGTASEQASAMQGREIRTQLQGNASRAVMGVLLCFLFPKMREI